MSKTQLLLDLADSLRSVADVLQEIVHCTGQNDSTDTMLQAEVPAQPVAITSPSGSSALPGLQPNERIDPETGEIIRLDLPTLRTLAAAKAQTKEQKTQMKALLQKHGVSKLTELPLSDYFAFQREVEAIV